MRIGKLTQLNLKQSMMSIKLLRENEYKKINEGSRLMKVNNKWDRKSWKEVKIDLEFE